MFVPPDIALSIRNEWARIKSEANVYNVFFGVIAVALISLLLGFVGAVLYAPPSPVHDYGIVGSTIMIMLCTLGAMAIVGNIGNQSTTSKELFWAWIIFTAILYILGAIGILEIWLLVRLFGG